MVKKSHNPNKGRKPVVKLNRSRKQESKTVFNTVENTTRENVQIPEQHKPNFHAIMDVIPLELLSKGLISAELLSSALEEKYCLGISIDDVENEINLYKPIFESGGSKEEIEYKVQEVLKARKAAREPKIAHNISQLEKNEISQIESGCLWDSLVITIRFPLGFLAISFLIVKILVPLVFGLMMIPIVILVSLISNNPKMLTFSQLNFNSQEFKEMRKVLNWIFLWD